MEGKASHSHRPLLCQFSCLLPTHDPKVCSPAFQKWHLPPVESYCRKHADEHCIRCRLLLTLWLASQHRIPLQNPSTSVLRSRLVSTCSGLPSYPYLHVLSYHSSTVNSRGSLQVAFRHFQLFLLKCQRAQAALLIEYQDAGRPQPIIATNCFCTRSSKFLPTSLEREQHAAIQYPNTRCSWQARCAFRGAFKKNKSSPNTSLNTKELSERLTIGPAERFCASHAPQLCLAAARKNLRLAPPRRGTRTNVRFDGCRMFSRILAICLRTCSESDSDCSVASSWSSSGSRFSVGCSQSLKCGWEGVEIRHFVWCVAAKCVFCALVHLFSCFVIAALTTRLTDSVDHPSARNSLADTKFVIAAAGPLKTNTSGCCWISSRSSGAS